MCRRHVILVGLFLSIHHVASVVPLLAQDSCYYGLELPVERRSSWSARVFLSSQDKKGTRTFVVYSSGFPEDTKYFLMDGRRLNAIPNDSLLEGPISNVLGGRDSVFVFSNTRAKKSVVRWDGAEWRLVEYPEQLLKTSWQPVAKGQSPEGCYFLVKVENRRGNESFACVWLVKDALTVVALPASLSKNCLACDVEGTSVYFYSQKGSEVTRAVAEVTPAGLGAQTVERSTLSLEGRLDTVLALDKGRALLGSVVRDQGYIHMVSFGDGAPHAVQLFNVQMLKRPSRLYLRQNADSTKFLLGVRSKRGMAFEIFDVAGKKLTGFETDATHDLQCVWHADAPILGWYAYPTQ